MNFLRSVTQIIFKLYSSEILNHSMLIFPFILMLSNPLSANSTKWSNTLKQFVGNSRQIVRVCLTILWGWRLKG